MTPAAGPWPPPETGAPRAAERDQNTRAKQRLSSTFRELPEKRWDSEALPRGPGPEPRFSPWCRTCWRVYERRGTACFTPTGRGRSMAPRTPGHARESLGSRFSCVPPPQVAEAIFAPFERGGRDPGDAVPGVGLRLAVSRGLARDIGGDLVLAPAVPGGGACFKLSIPLRR